MTTKMRDYIGQTLTVPHFNLRMRNVDLYDTKTVCDWRNLTESQEAFFSTGEFTSEDHRRSVLERKPHDYTWIMNCDDYYDQLVGMAGLTVDPHGMTGQANRLFVAPTCRIPRFKMGIPLSVLWFAFDVLGLESTWAVGSRAVHEAIGYNQVPAVDLAEDVKGPTFLWTFNRSDWKGLADWPDRIKGDSD